MDSGYSNMLEKTRKYFQGIPTDGQLEFPHQLHPHHPDVNGGRTAMNSEPSAAAAERFGYHPYMRYTYQPYSSPGHYPRTAVDPKPAAFQSQFQPPSTVFQKRQQLFLSTAAAASATGGPPSPYKSPYQQPQHQQQHVKPPAAQQPQSPFKVTQPVPQQQQQQQRQPPPPPQHHQSQYKYAPKPQQSPYPTAPVPSPYTISKPPQSPFTVPKEQQVGVQPPTVPETPPTTPHSHYLNRTTMSHSQALQDRDYLRFKPIQTPPKYQPLERPKSELPAGMVPITGGSQSSHLAIRYDPKLEQPRSGVRAMPIAQAKPAEANRVIVQKPEPLRYHRAVATDDKRPASVQPSYLESRPFQIKPYDGGSTSNSSSSSSSNSGGGGGGGGQQYHRPFAQQPSTSTSTDHRWNVFGRQDARTPVFQPHGSAINGFHQPASTSASPHHQQPTSAVHLTPRQPQQQQQQPSPQSPVPIQNYPLNLQKTTLPARLPVQITPQIKVTRENSSTQMATLRFDVKRESPLDLSVKTVCRSADSTDDRIHPFGHDIPKVNFKPDFNVCRTTTPSVYLQTNSQQNYQQPLPPLPPTQSQPPTSLSSADEAWRAAIDRQIEHKFNLYTSSKKQQQQHHSPAQADKRVLEILKQNIEARDQSKPQIAEAPSTPAMVFSTPIRKEPSTTPLKKTDYYMTERTGTPFPKKIDYYMDRANCNAPRIRTKAERKQITAEGSCSDTRMSSPMAAATAISPHPFLPSTNATPPTKPEQIPPAQTQVALDLKLEIKKEPSPIKDSELRLLNKDDVEKDNDDDEDFWMNTCNSFVSQLAETQDNKKVKSPIKRKVPKEPKRKYTKRIKVEPVSDSEQDKLCEENVEKPTETIELELPQEKPFDDQKSKGNVPKASTENERKSVFTENINDSKLLDKEEQENKKIKDKRPKQKPHKNINVRPYRAMSTKYINRYLKRNEKKEVSIKEKVKKQVEVKKEKKQLKVEKKELKKEVKIEKKDLKKGEKKELKKEVKIERKKLKKDIKKEDKKDLKKDDKKDDKKDTKEEKKDVKNKEEKKKEVKKELWKETTRKKSQKEHVTRNENTRRSDGKYNPRQSLRRKNSLKDYTYAFDELLDDAFAHFEEEKIPTKRRKKFSSPTPLPVVITKKQNNKENDETLKMRLRSRSKPLAKQEPVKKKNTVKNIPKRRRKKSLGEKSLHTPDWKDELYKFKRSLRLPSKLISVVSAPTTGTVAADQVSLTSIMDIAHVPPVKEPKVNSQVVSKKGLKNKIKRIGHLFGRRDVFKGRIKREKIVSAEKLMQRNLRKRRQENERTRKDEVVNKEIIVDGAQLEEVIEEKPAAQIFFKRKLIRKKFRSGFDYIKKKKKKCTTTEPTEKKPVVIQPQLKPVTPRFASEIQAEVKGWIVNKGHGETILHRAARQGCKDVVAYCIERLEYVPSIADNAGYTPLHEACSQGHYEIAKLLLQFGADVSASAQGGIRPLHEAVENGDVHLVRLLLSYGADPKLATYSGQSPLSIATDKQTKMLLEYHMNDIQGTGNVPVWNFDNTSLNCEPQFVDRMLWLSPSESSSENPTFQFEFSEQVLPDVYKFLDSSDDTEWVLFSDVSSALSVKTTEALVKLLDDENAMTTISAARFNECLAAKTPLGYCKPESPKVVSEENEPIVLVRYDNKIKEMLGVDVYSVS